MSQETLPFVHGSATSQHAAHSMQEHAATGKEIVRTAIKAAGLNGLSDEEGIAVTGLKESTYRPRRISLVGDERKGIPAEIIDYGVRRKTSSGHDAVVWFYIGIKA